MNIGGPKALRVGAGRTAGNWRLWLLFYCLNLLFAAVLALPFAAALMRSVSKSLAGSDLLSGFSYRWYVEFIYANGRYFGSIVPQIVLLFAIYVLVEVFFSGGFFYAFSKSGRTGMSTFFSKSASNFFPVLAVTLSEILLSLILYKLDAVWAEANVDAARRAVADSQVLHAEILRFVVIIAAFVIVNMLSDFVRAAVVLDDDGFLSKMKRGFSFAARHPIASFGVYLGAALLAGLIIAGWFLVNPKIRAINENGVLLEIAVGQIFVLLRIFSKLIFYAGEATLYKENQIEVIKVKPEMLE